MPTAEIKQERMVNNIATICAQGGDYHNEVTGEVTSPISMATTYRQSSPGIPIGDFDYSRAGNPNRQLLEETVAKLESTDSIVGYGTAYSSGLAAIHTLLSLVPAGSHIVCVDDVYGGVNRLLSKVMTHFRVTRCPLSNEQEVSDALLAGETAVLWVETPTNPCLKLVDLNMVNRVLRSKCPDAWLVVDNTFATPCLQKPLAHGADVVIHSATKYLNGHSDVLQGLLVTKHPELHQRLQFLQCAVGAVPSPFECWLCLRGMKTLALRMEAHCRNAMQIAQFLATHPMVSQVFYPGLTSHPQHQLAGKQMKGYGGMVSFRLKETLTLAQACKLCQSTKLFTLAESLGGTKSLIELPAIMTHASVPPDQRAVLGITDGFVRLSVGIEHVDDLIADLSQAFKQLK